MRPATPCRGRRPLIGPLAPRSLYLPSFPLLPRRAATGHGTLATGNTGAIRGNTSFGTIDTVETDVVRTEGGWGGGVIVKYPILVVDG